MSINMKAVVETVVDASLEHFKLATSGDLEKKVRRLQAQQRKDTPKKRLSQPCTVCGGESDLQLKACPFCGDESVDQPEPVAPPAPPPDKPAMETRGSMRKRSEVGGKAAKSPEAVTGEIVPDGIRRLDDAINEVREGQRRSVSGYWDVGRALLKIFDDNLWKHRLGPDGKPLYKGWNGFVSGVFGIVPAYSYKIMDCARFFSREDFQEIGVSKLVQILRLPESQRAALVQEARDGNLPRTRLEELIAEEKPERRPPRERAGGAGGGFAAGGGGKPGSGRAKKDKDKPAAKSDGEITAVSALGRVKLPLFARAKNAKDKADKRATSLAQDPHAREELVNGVVVHYRIVRDSKGLSLIIERRRLAAEE